MDRFTDDTRTGLRIDGSGGLTRGAGDAGRVKVLRPFGFVPGKLGPVKLIVGPWKVIVVPEEGFEAGIEGIGVALGVVMTVGCFSKAETTGFMEGLLNVTRVG